MDKNVRNIRFSILQKSEISVFLCWFELRTENLLAQREVSLIQLIIFNDILILTLKESLSKMAVFILNLFENGLKVKQIRCLFNKSSYIFVHLSLD